MCGCYRGVMISHGGAYVDNVDEVDFTGVYKSGLDDIHGKET